MRKKGIHKKLYLSRSRFEFSDNRYHDLIPIQKTGSFLSFHSIANYQFRDDSLVTIAIDLENEGKLYKREVYTTLSLIGDIGGLHDGLFLITSILLVSYNVSMF